MAGAKITACNARGKKSRGKKKAPLGLSCGIESLQKNARDAEVFPPLCRVNEKGKIFKKTLAQREISPRISGAVRRFLPGNFSGGPCVCFLSDFTMIGTGAWMWDDSMKGVCITIAF